MMKFTSKKNVLVLIVFLVLIGIITVNAFMFRKIYEWKTGLPLRSLFREKVAIGTFLQNWVLKGSLICVKSPYFINFYENNAYIYQENVS